MTLAVLAALAGFIFRLALALVVFVLTVVAVLCWMGRPLY